MAIYFTADLHLGSTNIIKYCDRPFKNADHMIKRLVNEINQRCRPEDVLMHLGDFVLYGKERGIESLRLKVSDLEAMINCKVIHILGNHDANNGAKSGLEMGVIKLSKNYTACLTHTPPWYDNNKFVPVDGIDVYLCGHLHEKWKVKEFNGKPVINIGCDQWNYRPVSKPQLIKFIEKL